MRRLTFSADNYRRQQYVTVRAKEDANRIDETAKLSHAASGSSRDYHGLKGADMVVNVSDATSLGLEITGVPAAINSTAAFTAAFRFTEPVTGFDTEDVTVAGGAKGALSGNGTDYTLEVTPSGNGDVTVAVRAEAATDGGGHRAPMGEVSATAVWDTTPPTLRIGVPAGINLAPFTATFTFDGPVTGFGEEDVTVTGGTKGAFGGSGADYTLLVTPSEESGEGDVESGGAGGGGDRRRGQRGSRGGGGRAGRAGHDRSDGSGSPCRPRWSAWSRSRRRSCFPSR